MVNLQGKAKYPVNQAVIDHRWCWPMLTYEIWDTHKNNGWNILEHIETWRILSEWTRHFCMEMRCFNTFPTPKAFGQHHQLPSFSAAQINVLKSHGQSCHESILIPNGYAMQIMRASQDRLLNLSKKWCFCICGTVKLVVTKVRVGLD